MYNGIRLASRHPCNVAEWGPQVVELPPLDRTGLIANSIGCTRSSRTAPTSIFRGLEPLRSKGETGVIFKIATACHLSLGLCRRPQQVRAGSKTTGAPRAFSCFASRRPSQTSGTISCLYPDSRGCAVSHLSAVRPPVTGGRSWATRTAILLVLFAMVSRKNSQ